MVMEQQNQKREKGKQTTHLVPRAPGVCIIHRLPQAPTSLYPTFPPCCLYIRLARTHAPDFVPFITALAHSHQARMHACMRATPDRDKVPSLSTPPSSHTFPLPIPPSHQLQASYALKETNLFPPPAVTPHLLDRAHQPAPRPSKPASGPGDASRAALCPAVLPVDRTRAADSALPGRLQPRRDPAWPSDHAAPEVRLGAGKTAGARPDVGLLGRGRCRSGEAAARV